MSAQKLTPGPWHLGQDGPFGISVWGGEDHVADVKNWDRDARAANARLIAAAPEMLEALRGVVGSLESKGAWKVANALKLAKSALAKAEGLS